MTVGVVGISHGMRRYTDVPFEEASLIRTYDAVSFVNFVRRRLRKSPIPATDFLLALHCDLGLSRAQVLHHFNKVSFLSTPWVVTFEHFVPRWDMESRWGMRLLAGSKCKKLIAMSRWAYEAQCRGLEPFPDLKDAILEKTVIIHPAQESLFPQFPARVPPDGEIRFAFVGREFFLKGGMETLRAFDRLSREGYPVKLTLVSPLWCGDYITKSTERDVESARRMLDRLKHCVTHFEYMDNRDVLKLFAASHASLLPTMNDTYGFVVLESQAAGCPVISTDSCALPEINDNSQGWLISVPKDSANAATYKTPQQLRELSSAIEEGVYTTIKEICANPSVMEQKARKGFQRIRQDHDPLMVARKQEEIYREAIKD